MSQSHQLYILDSATKLVNGMINAKNSNDEKWFKDSASSLSDHLTTDHAQFRDLDLFVEHKLSNKLPYMGVTQASVLHDALLTNYVVRKYYYDNNQNDDRVKFFLVEDYIATRGTREAREALAVFEHCKNKLHKMLRAGL